MLTSLVSNLISVLVVVLVALLMGFRSGAGVLAIVIGDHTGAASAYVAMTRGRQHNAAHLVADSVADARAQWTAVFARDRADLGTAHATYRAAEDIDRYGPRAARRATALQGWALHRQYPNKPTRALHSPPMAGPDR